VMRFPVKHHRLKRLPIDLPMTLRPLALITLKNRTVSPAAQMFTDRAREAAKALASKG
jgi:DNA-binding transcriptional LysR family regulator